MDLVLVAIIGAPKNSELEDKAVNRPEDQRLNTPVATANQTDDLVGGSQRGRQRPRHQPLSGVRRCAHTVPGLPRSMVGRIGNDKPLSQRKSCRIKS